MDQVRQYKKIEVRKIQKLGRGVFALENIKQDQLIEVCPVIPVPYKQLGEYHELNAYTFYWDEENVAVVFGFGSFYNHSKDPNCYFVLSKRNKTVSFYAAKNIKKGDEMRFDYGIELWFDYDNK